MKVALVHDYLNEFGGAERVLLALSEIYPDAPIYTIYAKKGSAGARPFAGKKIIQSWFSLLPFSHILISPLRFLVPFIWSTFEFSKYDLVLTSSSWAVTRGMRKGKNTIEICYLHTPPRYLYGYDTSRNWKNKWFASAVWVYSIFVNHFMRIYDFNQAQKPEHFVVNSKNVLKRLQKFYRRDGVVIYPPIELDVRNAEKIKPEKGEYYLAGGRLVAAKNFHLIIKAFNENKVPLKVFGTGLLEKELKAMAGKNIEFVGRVSDDHLVALFKGARAFVVAQEDEDMGITQVEAMQFGTPVVAYAGGGYLETVIEGKTGVFFKELTPDSINGALEKIQKMRFKKEELYKQAKKFSKAKFKNQMEKFVESVMKSK